MLGALVARRREGGRREKKRVRHVLRRGSCHNGKDAVGPNLEKGGGAAADLAAAMNLCPNAAHPCDESGSGWAPGDSPSKSGSTGWLRTSWPLEGGVTFGLTFSIHDEGDCVFDSIVFLDNFQWLGDAPEGGTTPVE